jgi:glycosyltransferase involved in cell wall biosynthesis
MNIGLVYDCIYPYTLGGVEHRNGEMARRWCGEHRVTLFGYDYFRRDPARRIPGVHYASIGAARRVHGPDGKRRITDSFAAALGTFNALLRTDAQVWDIANIAVLPVLAAALAAKLRRRGLVVTWFEFFDHAWSDYLGSRLGPLARRLERAALFASPRILVGSPLTRDRILAAGYPNARMHYVPNGIDTRLIAAVRRWPGTGADFVTAGRLTPHKRVHLAIDALHIVHRAQPAATLWIIGDGPERTALERRVVDLNLQKHVMFHGFLAKDEDVFARMKACRAALFPSGREGFGLAAVQAWACGLPTVVCNDTDNATAGLLTDARLGTVVPPTADAIAEAAIGQLHNDAIAFRIEHAQQQYDLDVMLVRTLAVYGQCVNSA